MFSGNMNVSSFLISSSDISYQDNIEQENVGSAYLMFRVDTENPIRSIFSATMEKQETFTNKD